MPNDVLSVLQVMEISENLVLIQIHSLCFSSVFYKKEKCHIVKVKEKSVYFVGQTKLVLKK